MIHFASLYVFSLVGTLIRHASVQVLFVKDSTDCTFLSGLSFTGGLIGYLLVEVLFVKACPY